MLFSKTSSQTTLFCRWWLIFCARYAYKTFQSLYNIGKPTNTQTHISLHPYTQLPNAIKIEKKRKSDSTTIELHMQHPKRVLRSPIDRNCSWSNSISSNHSPIHPISFLFSARVRQISLIEMNNESAREHLNADRRFGFWLCHSVEAIVGRMQFHKDISALANVIYLCERYRVRNRDDGRAKK